MKTKSIYTTNYQRYTYATIHPGLDLNCNQHYQHYGTRMIPQLQGKHISKRDAERGKLLLIA